MTSIETLRHGGTDQLAAPRPLEAGHFTLGLEAPALRNVAIEEHIIAQTITFTVRDKVWGTVAPVEWSATVENESGRLRVDMAGRYTSNDIVLEANATMRTSADGSLTYTVTATALRDFERARIGICVMHPATLSGRPLHVTTPDGGYSAVFPVDVSADRSISDIVALRHGIEDGRDVLLEFSGDLFEFEDQRNWADASYKTFCTPLSLPRPVSVASGEVIEQRVRLSTIGLRISTIGEKPLSASSAPVSSPGIARGHVDLRAEGKTIPSIGVLAGTEPRALMAAKELGVSHVRVTLDARSDTAAEDLLAVHQTLAGSDIGIEVELVADDPSDLSGLGAAIAELGDRLRWLFVFDRKT